MGKLTDSQKRILRAIPQCDFILLRNLADKLDLSSNQARLQVRKLQALGSVVVAEPKHYGEPLGVRLAGPVAAAKVDFDKLLINARWV